MDSQIANHYLRAPEEQLLHLGGSQQPATLLRALKNTSDGDLLRGLVLTEGGGGGVADPLAAASGSASHALVSLIVVSARIRAHVHRRNSLLASSGTSGSSTSNKRLGQQHAFDATDNAHSLFSHAERVSRLIASTPHIAAAAFVPAFTDSLTGFARALASLADATHTPAIAVAPLRNLVLAEPVLNKAHSSHAFTRIHPILLKYAILAKMQRLVLPIVSTPLSSVNKTDYLGITATDFLAYNYYSGLVFAALKQFDAAVDAFRACLAHPTKNGGASAIQIEAWRTGVLCWVLAHGGSTESSSSSGPVPAVGSALELSVPSTYGGKSNNTLGVKGFERGGVGKSMSGSVSKAIESSHGRKAYSDFVAACESGIRGAVEFELAKSMDLLAKSNNLGLARQCLRSLASQRIQKLTQTYLTLSVHDIAKAVESAVLTRSADAAASAAAAGTPTVDDAAAEPGPGAGAEGWGGEAVKAQLVDLVTRGRVCATIDEGLPGGADVASGKVGGMVSFHDDAGGFTDVQSMSVLDTAMRRAVRLYDAVVEMDRAVGASREFLVKQAAFDKSGGGGGGVGAAGAGLYGGAAGMVFDQDGAEMDEDVLMMGADEEMH
ncbi:hypothetical protein BC830DRAFT_1172943 [Chytriomyces sp. MP71]|nr:hypothetical protein BC830DRAFT_1172943 [Chytriomyces sp. MP71]